MMKKTFFLLTTICVMSLTAASAQSSSQDAEKATPAVTVESSDVAVPASDAVSTGSSDASKSNCKSGSSKSCCKSKSSAKACAGSGDKSATGKSCAHDHSATGRNDNDAATPALTSPPSEAPVK